MVEEAVHLLRMGPPGALFAYYVGSLPFVLGILYYWADMSKSAMAYEHCALGASVVALLYLWMKCWHAVFAAFLHAYLVGKDVPVWTWDRIRHLVVAQIVLQPYSLILLPIAFVLTLPYGWMSAFFHNVSYLGDGQHDLKTVFTRSREQAGLESGQNHRILLVLFSFGFFVFLNLATGIFLIPHLFKMLFGIETVFTLSRWCFLNTTFLAVLVSVTFLCMNPLIKTVYALRSFYGLSRQTGEDLKTELRRGKGGAGWAAALLILVLVVNGLAEERDVDTQKDVPAQKLNEALDDVLQHPEYSWRLPREKIKTTGEESGFFGSFFDEVGVTLKKAWKPFKKLWNKFLDWVDDLFPKAKDKPKAQEREWDWRTSLQIVVFTILTATVSLLAILLFRKWKERGIRTHHVASQAIVAKPNLNDEKVQASELPWEEWMALARELMAKGERRLALRAFYLASLAFLSHREWIGIAVYKSNRDYLNELGRRSHALPTLIDFFSQNVAVFEAVWYGLHPVDEVILGKFQENLHGILRIETTRREEAQAA